MIRQPLIGETLIYALTGDDVCAIRETMARGGNVGNYHGTDQRVPFVVVRVWPGEFGENEPHGVNGVLILDANFTHWKTSAPHGNGPGTWNYMD